MAGQTNFSWYHYVDDQARPWAVRANNTWATNAASGLTSFVATDPPFGRHTRRRSPRRVVYQDPVTFRTFGGPVGTAAAFAALPGTLPVNVIGVATPFTYNLSARIPERMPIPKPSRNAPQGG